MKTWLLIVSRITNQKVRANLWPQKKNPNSQWTWFCVCTLHVSGNQNKPVVNIKYPRMSILDSLPPKSALFIYQAIYCTCKSNLWFNSFLQKFENGVVPYYKSKRCCWSCCQMSKTLTQICMVGNDDCPESDDFNGEMGRYAVNCWWKSWETCTVQLQSCY